MKSVLNNTQKKMKTALQKLALNSELVDENYCLNTNEAIKTLLHHKNELIQLKGMRIVFKRIVDGEDMMFFYTDVIKCMYAKNEELRRLIYIYIAHYATFEKETGLLAISSLQKSLQTPSLMNKKGSLVALSKMGLEEAAPILLMAITDKLRDVDSTVRAVACSCIKSLMKIDPSLADSCIDLLKVFITDSSRRVLAMALKIIVEIFPDHLDLLHTNFRRICNDLSTMSPWEKINVIHCLIFYTRKFFVKPRPFRLLEANENILDAFVVVKEPTDDSHKNSEFKKDSHEQTEVNNDLHKTSELNSDSHKTTELMGNFAEKRGLTDASSSFYDALNSIKNSTDVELIKTLNESDDGELETEKITKKESNENGTSNVSDDIEDTDYQLVLKSILAEENSFNDSVSLLVISFIFECASEEYYSRAVNILIKVLSNSSATSAIALNILSVHVKTHCDYFRPCLELLYLYFSDSLVIKSVKLKLIPYLIDEFNYNIVVEEIDSYVKSGDVITAIMSITALKKCAELFPKCHNLVLNSLISYLSDTRSDIIEQTVICIRALLHLSKSTPYSNVSNDEFKTSEKINDSESSTNEPSKVFSIEKIISKIYLALPNIKTYKARCSVIWLISENATLLHKVAPDFLRIVAKTFSEEHKVTKLQILELSSHLILLFPLKVQHIHDHLMKIAKYDKDYEVRDRVRFLNAVFTATEEEDEDDLFIRENAKSFIFVEKPEQKHVNILESVSFKINSISFLINQEFKNYIPIPEFATEPLDPHIRDPVSKFGTKSGVFELSQGLLDDNQIENEEYEDEIESDEVLSEDLDIDENEIDNMFNDVDESNSEKNTPSRKESVDLSDEYDLDFDE